MNAVLLSKIKDQSRAYLKSCRRILRLTAWLAGIRLRPTQPSAKYPGLRFRPPAAAHPAGGRIRRPEIPAPGPEISAFKVSVVKLAMLPVNGFIGSLSSPPGSALNRSMDISATRRLLIAKHAGLLRAFKIRQNIFLCHFISPAFPIQDCNFLAGTS